MEDTLFENIRMGSNATEEQVVAAAKAAQIDDFICTLPQGYQTRIGDKGVKLSGGQQQRIAIARAILKDAPIVIFDEATSYSDIENEHKIQLALQSLLKGKTTIMIAYRLHTIRNADNIVVFDAGQIVEQDGMRTWWLPGDIQSYVEGLFGKGGGLMLHTIQKLIGKSKKELYFPIFLMCIDSLGSMALYFVLYLTVLDLFFGTLTMNKISIYTLVCLLGVIYRIIVYRKKLSPLF